MAYVIDKAITLDGLGVFLAGADLRYAPIGSIPTSLSELTDDVGYLTRVDTEEAVAAACVGGTWATIEGSRSSLVRGITWTYLEGSAD